MHVSILEEKQIWSEHEKKNGPTFRIITFIVVEKNE